MTGSRVAVSLALAALSAAVFSPLAAAADESPTIASCLQGEVGRSTHFCLQQTGDVAALPLIFEVAGQHFEDMEPGDRLPKDYYDAAENAARLASQTEWTLLFEWADAQQPTTRAFGLHALGYLLYCMQRDNVGGPKADPALLERVQPQVGAACSAALDDPDPRVVEHALDCLGRTDDPVHAADIVDILLERSEPRVRRKAMSTLGDLPGLGEHAGDLRPLIQILGQPYEHVGGETPIRGEICNLLRRHLRAGETWPAEAALAAVEHIGERSSQARDRCRDLAIEAGADPTRPEEPPRSDGNWFADVVREECWGEDLGERHVTICARSEPADGRQRAFSIVISDQAILDPATGKHMVIRRTELGLESGEYLDLAKVSTWDLDDRYQLLFVPVVTGTPTDYTRGRSLLFLLDGRKLRLRLAWTSPDCPEGCTWQTLSTLRRPDDPRVEVTYTATSRGSRFSETLVFKGRKLRHVKSGGSDERPPPGTGPSGTAAPFDALAEMRRVPEHGWVDIRSTGDHSCALDADGRVACWGNDGNGQCQTDGRCVAYYTGLECTDGALHGSACLTDADCVARPFVAVSAGYPASCAVDEAGRIRCWGSPLRLLPGTYADVSLGFHQQCGLRTDGTVACLGNGDWAPEGTFVQLDAGGAHVCAVRPDGTAECWGETTQGQTKVPPGRFAEVSAGGQHSCGIAGDLAVLCWGDDSHGQSSPPPGRFIQVAVGNEHSCGLRPEGAVECWGMDGVTTPPDTPMVHIAAGRYHTCGLTADGRILCWGSNRHGQCEPPD